MRTLKRKTIGGETHRLVRKSTDKPGKQYEYTIRLPDNRIADDRRFYRKDKAMSEFREHVRLVEKGAEREQQSGGPGLPFGGGMEGGESSGPYIPGMTSDESEDDDRDPFLPGL